MKNFDLNALGVKEMENVEIRETNGGIIGVDDLLFAAAVCIAYDIVSNWSDSVASFNAGRAAAQK